MAVLYWSTSTGRLRKVVLDDVLNDSRILANNPVHAGETAGYMPLGLEGRNSEEVGSIADRAQAEVNRRTGREPGGDTYQVVNSSGEVVNTIIADPLCGDSIPGCTLVLVP